MGSSAIQTGLQVELFTLFSFSPAFLLFLSYYLFSFFLSRVEHRVLTAWTDSMDSSAIQTGLQVELFTLFSFSPAFLFFLSYYLFSFFLSLFYSRASNMDILDRLQGQRQISMYKFLTLSSFSLYFFFLSRVERRV